ncbi:hypothetical protein PtB15_6B117 [Puccinia triticina]|nr:hypothetical protein PtB15_6B117 [Puccinia triticina]
MCWLGTELDRKNPTPPPPQPASRILLGKEHPTVGGGTLSEGPLLPATRPALKSLPRSKDLGPLPNQPLFPGSVVTPPSPIPPKPALKHKPMNLRKAASHDSQSLRPARPPSYGQNLSSSTMSLISNRSPFDSNGPLSHQSTRHNGLSFVFASLKAHSPQSLFTIGIGIGRDASNPSKDPQDIGRWVLSPLNQSKIEACLWDVEHSPFANPLHQALVVLEVWQQISEILRN